MAESSPEQQLATYMNKYDPAIRELAKAVLAKLRGRLAGAVELVYDNYNALVIGFGPSERASEAILSVALYPRWVSLFFLQGAGLPDPQKLLRGSGKVVRSIVLGDAADLDQPAVGALIDAALERAAKPLEAGTPRRLVIRSVSAKQRPRRPVKSG
jgi:hypothetical protein